jgi:ABC-type transport system substrate-binding protein
MHKLRPYRNSLFVALSLSLLIACAPQQTSGGTSSSPASSDAAQAGKVVTIIGRTEPVHLAEPGLRPSGTSIGNSTRPFNAGLDRQDSRETYVPYLAEALPQLDTDTWRVFADGRMETRYTLKPNLTWHDGSPLSAEDFVFAWKVYTTPELGVAGNALRADMALSAPDARTLLIQWKRPRTL